MFAALVAIAVNGPKLAPASLLFVLGVFSLVLIYNGTLEQQKIDGD